MKESIKMQEFSIDFFRDEVRNGFFVPTALKQAWASQLVVLDVIDSICKKHDIKYFADWGTMLGTVRHGGYVPWDDDMDICMKREDYIKFKEIAKYELPDNFCIHDYEQKENHWLFLSRVVNNKHICYEPEHMNKFFNFPYLVGIDIFVLDYLYEDEEKEKRRCKEIKNIIAVADMIVENNISQETKEVQLSQFEQNYNKKFDRNLDNRHIGIQLYRLAEEQMARVPKEKSNRMAQIFPWGLLGNRGMEKSYYEKFVRLPFENTTMPVPANYHKILRKKYGDYFKINKVWNGHKYPFFEAQREQLQAVANFKLPEFTFNKNMLRTNNINSNNMHTMQQTVSNILNKLEKLYKSFYNIVENNEIITKIDQCMDLLEQSQEVTINLGNYVEKMSEAQNKSVKRIVEQLEQYCELIFQVYNYLKNDINNDKCYSVDGVFEEKYRIFIECFNSVKAIIKKEIIDKKIVLFLPDNPQRWNELKKLYEYYNNKQDTEIYVIPLPIFIKNLYGEIIVTDEEWKYNDRKKEYPQDINIISWDAINISDYQFEAIIIQNQYDGENPYLTVPTGYYAKELQNYTNNLIYVMPQGINDFCKDDITDMYGLKWSLAMPATMYADKVLIQSFDMKQIFVDYLTEFAGKETEDIWNDKIVGINEFIGLKQSYQETTLQQHDRKIILYCIGENEFAENIQLALCKVKERLNIMTQYPDKLSVAVCLYPYNICEWGICKEEQKQDIINLLEEYKISKGIQIYDYSDIGIDNIDAYYGSPSPLICSFIEKHKPVMVSYDEK